MNWIISDNKSYGISLNQKQIDKIYSVTKPCMEYISNRLFEIENWTMDDAKRILSEIVDEMPIMSYRISPSEGQVIIHYNRYADIILTDPFIQIYREQKLNKILK